MTPRDETPSGGEPSETTTDPNEQPSLVALTEEQRQAALERYEILRPCLEQGVPVCDAAKLAGLGVRTLERFMADYRRRGLQGLVRKRRSDRGRRRKVTDSLERLVEGLALQTPTPTAAAIHRTVSEVAAKKGWDEPSYGSVYSIIHNLDPSLVCLAHDGSKAYQERFDLIHRREAEQPNEIWQADHTLLDIWLLDERGAPRRPWLTCIMDDHSRAIAGYFVGFDAPSALITSLALRLAIWRKEDPRWHICGVPERFYTDHGSDFTSRHLEQVAAELKMRLVFSIPGMPRGRGRIERFFGTVNQLLLCHLPGYGGSTARRSSATLTLSTFDQRFREFLLGDYHRRRHSGTGIEPQTRWDADGFLPRLPDSLEQLDLLLLTVAKTRRVRQDGIRFHQLRYIDSTLAGYVGEDVIVRYDPSDLAQISIFHDDAFLCRATCQELAGQSVGLKDIIRARNRRRRQLRGEIKDRSAIVDQFLAVHHPNVDGFEAAPSAPDSSPAPRLKRYHND
jgi:putative transposase